MNRREKGFTLIETIVGVALVSLLALGGTVATYHTLRITESSDARLTAVGQVESAAFWIARDAQMAETIFTDQLDEPDFIIMGWRELVYESDPIYHSVTYSFQNVTDYVGQLKRHHWTNTGTNDYTVVANYIYIRNGNPPGTSLAVYISPVLNLRLVAHFKNDIEMRNYSITRRPNFNY